MRVEINRVIEVTTDQSNVPWRTGYKHMDGEEYIELVPYQKALHKCAGPDVTGMDVSSVCWMVIKARDHAINTMLDAKYAEDPDLVRPRYFAAACMGVVMPDAIDIVVPGWTTGDGKNSFPPWPVKVLTGTKLHGRIHMQCTEGNVSKFLAWSAAYHNSPPAELDVPQDEAAADNDGGGTGGAEDMTDDEDIDYGPVKWRKNRGNQCLYVRWQNADGSHGHKWEKPRKGNTREVVAELRRLREDKHHVTKSDGGRPKKQTSLQAFFASTPTVVES